MNTSRDTPRIDTEPGLLRTAGVFVTTHWSVVLSACDPPSPQSNQALEILCRTYWHPLYAYIRRMGHGPQDAEDLTQEFFARLLSKHYLKAADRQKGRFRTFLLVALKRFLANEWKKGRALKRGGRQCMVPLDTVLAEKLYTAESPNQSSPEQLYERRWALALVEQALGRLKADYERQGKSAEFERLKVYLTAERGGIPYSQVASELGISEGAARVSIHRLRRRFREVFQQEVAGTLANPDDLQEEMKHLQEMLSE